MSQFLCNVRAALIDPIFETKRRPALRGLLYAYVPLCTLPKQETNDIGTRMSRHAKGKLVAFHLYADKIKTYIKNHTKIRKPCLPLRGILRKTLRFSLMWNPIFALCHHRTVVCEEKNLYTLHKAHSLVSEVLIFSNFMDFPKITLKKCI